MTFFGWSGSRFWQNLGCDLKDVGNKISTDRAKLQDDLCPLLYNRVSRISKVIKRVVFLNGGNTIRILPNSEYGSGAETIVPDPAFFFTLPKFFHI